MSTQPGQNTGYPQSSSPPPETNPNQYGQQPQSPPQNSAYPTQGYAPQQPGYYPPPPPPGTFVATTVHPSNQNWVSSGASIAGVLIAGRCLIGIVSSGIGLIIAAIIMYAQANSFDYSFSNGTIYYSNPLRTVAPVVLGLGILLLIGGVAGIIVAYRSVQKRRQENATLSTTTTVVSPAPVLSGQNQNLYGQQNPGYYGAAGGYSQPPPAGAPSNQPGFENPPPYNTQEKPLPQEMK